jgi:hypothetical protein
MTFRLPQGQRAQARTEAGGMAISKELADFEKKYKMMRRGIDDHTGKDAAYKTNAIKTYMTRLKGTGEDFAEAVGYAQDEGFSGSKVQDYVKDTDVANALKGYKRVFEDLEDETAALKKLSEGALATLDKVQRLKADLDKKVGKKPEAALKKDYELLAKGMDKDEKDLKDTAAAFKVLPKEALAAAKSIDANLAALIKAAATIPRKPKEPLPKELEKGPFDRTVKDFKALQKKLAGALKAAKGDKLAESVDEGGKIVEEIKEIADKLSQLRKSARDAIRRAPHGSEIVGTEELAQRTARDGKAALAKLEKAASKGG